MTIPLIPGKPWVREKLNTAPISFFCFERRDLPMKQEPEKLLYSVSEARQALGVGKNTIYKLIARDGFPKLRLVGHFKFRSRIWKNGSPGKWEKLDKPCFAQ